jgi:predicted dehydrogenase
MTDPVRIGIIGGGLMGRETASALGRWFALDGHPVRAELVAVCDISRDAREWFRRVPTVTRISESIDDLLTDPDIDLLYVALPHNLHEQVYGDVLRAGKDLLAEKPFGIDLAAAERIAQVMQKTGRFVRVSSEFPFLPGAQRVVHYLRSGTLGKLLEVRAGFWHSSDLDPQKPVNWKRQAATCGPAGVMADLGIHVMHIPFRLGWIPRRVYAQLQKIYDERPDGKGGMAKCDTWDNAMLHTEFVFDGAEVPMRLEMKRLAPGETNTWFIEALGTEGGVRFSTKEPKTLWTFARGKEQTWQRIDVGHISVFPTVTGGIFEAGFPDCFLQMWGAFLAERAGALEGRFGCVTPEEAVLSHRVMTAALASQTSRRAENVVA